jgi:hypothetical protein
MNLFSYPTPPEGIVVIGSHLASYQNGILSFKDRICFNILSLTINGYDIKILNHQFERGLVYDSAFYEFEGTIPWDKIQGDLIFQTDLGQVNWTILHKELAGPIDKDIMVLYLERSVPKKTLDLSKIKPQSLYDYQCLLYTLDFIRDNHRGNFDVLTAIQKLCLDIAKNHKPPFMKALEELYFDVGVACSRRLQAMKWSGS